MHGSTVVVHSNTLRPFLIARTNKSYHSIKVPLSWSGRGNQPGIKKLGPGTYVVQVVEGAYVGTTTIRIVR